MKTPPSDVQIRRAEVRASSVDTKKRTAEVVWTTGAKVLRSSWDGPYFEELSLDPAHVDLTRLASGRAPFLADHDGALGAVIGVVESARLEAGRGVAVVRFAKAEDDPEADRVFRKIADGIIQNVSVGYRVHKLEKVEGGDATAPTFRATRWEPYELSAVAMPADPSAHVRAMQSHPKTNRKNMEPKVSPVEDLAQLERDRVASIRSAVRSGGLGDDLAHKLITNGTTADRAREIVLDVLATRSEELPPAINAQHQALTAGEDASEKFARGAVSALLMRSAPDLVARAKEKGIAGFDKVDTGNSEFRGLSIVELARESLERRGIRTGSMGRMEVLGRAFTTRGGPYAGTADFPILLETTAAKILLGAYATTPDTWSRFCKSELVPDFRASPRYRSGSFGVLDSLNENGEYKNKAIPDGSKATISAATKGNIVAISRQALVNDDMSAFSDLLAKLGRAARLSVEVDVYALLNSNSGLGPTMTDGQPFFHAANRGNVNSTGSGLTVAGIDADRVVLGSQRDAQSNEYLDLRPAVLVVPLGLEGAARVINASQVDPDASKINMPNIAQGIFRDIVGTPRLTGTRRYLFADPSVAPALVVAFLDGQGQAPVLETDEGWRVDGTEMKVRFDYGVQVFDPKGAVTNAGQ